MRRISRAQLEILLSSDASNAVHRLGSIREADGDAVKAPSDRADQWW